MNLSLKDDDDDDNDDEIIDSGIQDTAFKFNFELLLNLYKREYAAPFPSCVTLGERHPNLSNKNNQSINLLINKIFNQAKGHSKLI